MPSNDKKKQIQKRLSKLKKLERKEKKRTKNKRYKSNNIYQKKNRTASYLLILFIVLLLVAIGTIVYFFVIKPKLDKNNKPKCAKNEDEDCQKNEYLDKEKCECLPCENPTPNCKQDEYYDPNNIPYCRNSNKYITDKDGNKKKMYSCQPCPTCPDGKPVNNCPKNDRTFDINNKDTNEACQRPTSDDTNKPEALSGGAIAGIVIGIVVVLAAIGYFIFRKVKNGAKETNQGANRVARQAANNAAAAAAAAVPEAPPLPTPEILAKVQQNKKVMKARKGNAAANAAAATVIPPPQGFGSNITAAADERAKGRVAAAKIVTKSNLKRMNAQLSALRRKRPFLSTNSILKTKPKSTLSTKNEKIKQEITNAAEMNLNTWKTLVKENIRERRRKKGKY